MSHTPPGLLKSGMPDSVLIPAPDEDDYRLRIDDPLCYLFNTFHAVSINPLHYIARKGPAQPGRLL